MARKDVLEFVYGLNSLGVSARLVDDEMNPIGYLGGLLLAVVAVCRRPVALIKTSAKHVRWVRLDKWESGEFGPDDYCVQYLVPDPRLLRMTRKNLALEAEKRRMRPPLGGDDPVEWMGGSGRGQKARLVPDKSLADDMVICSRIQAKAKNGCWYLEPEASSSWKAPTRVVWDTYERIGRALTEMPIMVDPGLSSYSRPHLEWPDGLRDRQP